MDPLSTLDFKKGDGLVTAVTLDDATGDVLMVAFMNEPRSAARSRPERSITGAAPGASSGTRARRAATPSQLKGLYIDCDADCVVLRVDQIGGAACHTGKRSCFYRRLDDGSWTDVGEQVFDPKEVYGK